MNNEAHDPVDTITKRKKKKIRKKRFDFLRVKVQRPSCCTIIIRVEVETAGQKCRPIAPKADSISRTRANPTGTTSSVTEPSNENVQNWNTHFPSQLSKKRKIIRIKKKKRIK